MSIVGIVIIGRNEGERLLRCLDSLGSGRPTVYADSGSTDGSVVAARARGVEVVEPDLSTPFTAARARNAGWQRLGSLAPDADYVQFVDGDCEVDAGWIDSASEYLDSHVDVAVVCGRRRERFPERSVYNRLCDLEWDTPIGEADSCGGDALMRLDAMRAVDGYRESMIAGEEPELCTRLRAGGGRIVRLDAEMTRHDAAMTSFRQWWTRAVRAGHAYAEGDSLTRGQPRGLWRREAQSTWFWGLLVPVLAFGLAWPTRGWSLLLLGGYAILGYRIYRFASRRRSPADARRYTCFGLMAKFAHLVGMLRYWRNRMLGRGSRLIEYKTAGVAS